MKFLLVNLNWSGLVSKKTFKIHFALPPLDLLLLYNLAKQNGHEAKIFDGFVEPSDNLSSLSAEADWIIVTTTPYHMWQCPNAEWEQIKASLAQLPPERSVVLGLHSSVFPEQTLRETGVAAVIRREPEAVFKSFLAEQRWEAVAGVSWMEGESYRENPLGPLPPMDDLVVTDYDVDISRYGYFLLGQKTGVFEASRGCPWKCTFCDQEMFSWKYRAKSPEVFAEEVARGVRQTGMRTAYFYDLEFTIARKRTEEICEGLLQRGVEKTLKWACQTRADMIDPVMLDRMKAAGCRLIHFGVESGNADILKATNKKITLEKIEAGVRLAKEKGFQTACFFMFGLPEERPEEFDNTLRFARRLNPTYASFHFAVPFPGTPLYTRYLEERQLPWGSWPATYFNGWAHEEIRAYLKRAFIKFYLQPIRFEPREFIYRLGNIQQKLAYFRSFTA